MECKDSRSQFSAYIDEELTPEVKNLLDDHLKTCSGCSHALEEMRKSIALTRGLEELEPPPWLSEKVMAEIRQGAKEKKGIIARLFFPLHIKVPIEVFATVAIVVTAFYLFKTIEPDVQVTIAPTEGVSATESKSKDMTLSEPPAPAGGNLMKKSRRLEKAFRPVAEPESAGIVSDRAESENQIVHFSLYADDRGSGIFSVTETIETLGGTLITAKVIGDRTVISAELEEGKLPLLLERLALIGDVEEKEALQKRGKGRTLITIEVRERS